MLYPCGEKTQVLADPANTGISRPGYPGLVSRCGGLGGRAETEPNGNDKSNKGTDLQTSEPLLRHEPAALIEK
jgi:hypothetical protein